MINSPINKMNEHRLKNLRHSTNKQKNISISDVVKEFIAAFDEYNIAKEKRMQCWDFMKCSPEEYNKCTAYTQSAGRRCWLVAGSLNGGRPSCAMNKKQRNITCKECKFYHKIKAGQI